MKRPVLLDMFCGAGGAAMGYHRAGFDVVGVDRKPQKRYPFKFIQADAIEYALAHGWQYEAIHASPPCQTHSSVTPDPTMHEDLIPHTRFVLEALGLPYVIENVYGALKALKNPVMLCGTQFGLKVYRHRLFESNIMLLVPPHVPHRNDSILPTGDVFGGFEGYVRQWDGQGKRPKHFNTMVDDIGFITVTGNCGNSKYARFAMGIDWMTNAELGQAIPPAFTEFLGKQLLRAVEARREVA